MMPRRPGNEVSEAKASATNPPPILWRPPLAVTDKTPKNQVQGAESYNEMRQWIIDAGGMDNR